MSDTPTAPPPTVSPRMIEQGTEYLRDVQKLLSVLGRDERRKSNEFDQIMTKYKELGTALHEARKRLPPKPQAAPKALQPQGYGPTALGRARPAGAGPNLAAPGLLQPRPAGQVPATPAAGAVPAAGEPQEPGAEPAASPVEGAAPQAPPRPVPTLASPMALPKFGATLGPAGSRAVDKGPPVTHLQQLLHALGHLIEETGIYDAKTFRAVQEFQLARRIPINGLVGLETRKLLNELVSGESPAVDAQPVAPVGAPV